jgi:hypothetical protein
MGPPTNRSARPLHSQATESPENARCAKLSPKDFDLSILILIQSDDSRVWISWITGILEYHYTIPVCQNYLELPREICHSWHFTCTCTMCAIPVTTWAIWSADGTQKIRSGALTWREEKGHLHWFGTGDPRVGVRASQPSEGGERTDNTNFEDSSKKRKLGE